MKDLKSKIVEELDMIQHIANDIENRKDRDSLKRSVKKIRKELKQVKNNDLLHSVSDCIDLIKYTHTYTDIKHDKLFDDAKKHFKNMSFEGVDPYYNEIRVSIKFDCEDQGFENAIFDSKSINR